MAKGNNNLLLFGLMGLGAWLWYNNHNKLSNAYLRNLSYSIPSFDIKGDTVDVHIRIDNPNSQDIAIQSIVGNVIVDSEHIGRVAAYYQGEGLIIHGNNYSIIPVNIKVNLVETIALLASKLATGKMLNARFIGIISIDHTPINLQISMSKNVAA